MGLLVAYLVDRPAPARPFVGVGVLGGWTTFSALAVESRRLLAAGRTGLALSYLAGSLLVGLIAVGLGVSGGERAFGTAGDRAARRGRRRGRRPLALPRRPLGAAPLPGGHHPRDPDCQRGGLPHARRGRRRLVGSVCPVWLPPLVGIGFCGALTTFSTLAFETWVFFERREWRPFVANLALWLGLGAPAVVAGYAAGAPLL